MLDVVGYPSDVLLAPTHRVDVFDAALRSFVDDMVDVMYSSEGVGLAAPQVGSSRRLVLVDPSGGGEANQLLVMINPEVTWRSDELVAGEEGCLSLPGVLLNVIRNVSVQVEYDDVDGAHRLIRLVDDGARIAQHEIDHVDGVLMIDRVGTMARKIGLKGLGKNR